MTDGKVAQAAAGFQSFDLLSTLIAVVRCSGVVCFANAALEDALGLSRRAIVGSHFTAYFAQPTLLQTALAGVGCGELAVLRLEASLLRFGRDTLPVYVTVTRTEISDDVMVELTPQAQQNRHDREDPA